MSKQNKDFFKEQKPWSKTKNNLLACYLRPYFAKIVHTNKKLCYVDCFAGVGKFGDGNFGSPMIVLDIIDKLNEQLNTKLNIELYFIEVEHYAELSNNIDIYRQRGFDIKVINGKYEDNIINILETKSNYNVFLYIDPYGIKALNFNIFKQIATFKFNSFEMLMNFNSFGLVREACRVLKQKDIFELYNKQTLEEYAPSIIHNQQEISDIIGCDDWTDVFKNDNNINKEQVVVLQMKKNLGTLFKFVLDMPIRLNINTYPKYRMIHITNHEDGCVIMADNMYNRYKEHKNIQNKGQKTVEDFLNELEQSNSSEIVAETFDFQDISEIDMKNYIVDYLSENKYEIRLKTLYVNFIMDVNIIHSKHFSDVLAKMEKMNSIIVRREPPLTKNGKKQVFGVKLTNKKYLFQSDEI